MIPHSEYTKLLDASNEEIALLQEEYEYGIITRNVYILTIYSYYVKQTGSMVIVIK